MGLNRLLIGKHYPPQHYGVTVEATTKYAQAYNEDNPRFLDVSRPHDIVAPPLFGVVMSWPSLMTAVTDQELGVDLLHLLHREQDMVFYLPVVPGDVITSTTRIAAIEERPNGEILTVQISCVNQRGETVQDILFTAFIRDPHAREKPGERTEEAPAGEPFLRVRQTVDMDQTYRYAHASGDYNPIHTDENVAHLAGLPGIIVHGLCTMAFTSKVIIDHLCDRDPLRLKRLRVRFARPLFPGQEITTVVWQGQQVGPLRRYAYETYNPEGKAVIRNGIAEVS
ncbi:MAG: MaoC/PaaZ C-terminal domain-containing protein [Candidatus Binatia bacterium]|nr:MaoC/PaaZ C-terminal domain-containing protein [Candidatus Binatia bacterium]